MESIKKLKEAAGACLDELKSIESKVSITEGNIAFLTSKKQTLNAEISDLEAKKASIMDAVGLIEKDARAQIDERTREIKNKEDEIASLRSDLKGKLFQAESARAEAEQERAKYSELYAEYLVKVRDLDERKQAILAAAGK